MGAVGGSRVRMVLLPLGPDREEVVVDRERRVGLRLLRGKRAGGYR